MKTKTSLNILILVPVIVVFTMLVIFNIHNYQQQERSLYDKANITVNALTLDAITAITLGEDLVKDKFDRVLKDPEIDYLWIKDTNQSTLYRFPHDVESELVLTLPLIQSFAPGEDDALANFEEHESAVSGYLTIGLNKNVLRSEFKESLAFISMTCLAIFFLGLLVITPQKNRINRRIASLKGSLEKLANGNYEQVEFEPDNSEFDALSDELMKVSRALKEHDLSMRRKTEEITLAMETSDRRSLNLEQFLAKMSHEIRSPLSVIERSIEFIRATEIIDPHLKGHLTEWQQKLDLALRYTEDLLDATAPHLGLSVNSKPFHFDNEIRPFLRSYTELAGKKSLSFSFQLSSNLDSHFIGDKHRIQQVLAQLCSNAIKYTDSGEIQVKIHYEDKQLRISVNDTGIGIPEHAQNHIFELSKRATTSATGWGIGLAVVKSLVEAMGGDITVTSEIDKGSTFLVNIPLSLSELHASHSIGHINKPLKIMIVDNDPDHLSTSEKLISQIVPNASIVSASSGLEAISKVDSAFDMAFIDYRMPGLMGNQVIAELRKSYPDLYIAALTNSIDHKSEIACFEAGADAFLSKNLKLFELYNQIKNYRSHGRNTASKFLAKYIKENKNE